MTWPDAIASLTAFLVLKFTDVYMVFFLSQNSSNNQSFRVGRFSPPTFFVFFTTTTPSGWMERKSHQYVFLIGAAGGDGGKDDQKSLIWSWVRFMTLK